MTGSAATFSSVTVDGMRELIYFLEDARDHLHTAVDELRPGMTSAGLSTARLRDIDRIAEWVDSQLPELNRRLNLASSLARHQLDGSPVRIDEENLLTTDAAEQRGRELARILETDATDKEKVEGLHAELKPHVNDPDVMASFFTAMGVDTIQRLPYMIHESRVPDGRRHLAMISRGLATAISVPVPSSDILAIRHAFTESPTLPGRAWGRVALLQDGSFPPVWLEQAVRANALDEFVGAADYPVEHGSATLRLSGSRFALAFSALRHNPEAARRALDNDDYSISDYVQRIYRLDSLAMCHYDVPRAFGLAVESAAQADVDPADRHRRAEWFTYHFIAASTNRDEVPAALRESLERIAASYVHEFAAGSFADSGSQAAGIDPKGTRPNDFPAGSGIESSFFLTPRVTLRFIASFQRHPGGELVGPFTDAMGAEFDRLLDDAIVADKTDGGTRTDDLMFLFGGLNNILYIARRGFAADYEAQQEERRSQAAMIFGGLLSIPSFTGIGHLLWGAAQNLASRGANELAESDGGVTSQIDAEQETAENVLWYLVAERLVEHGVGGDALSNAPDRLVDDDELRPIAEILADAELRREFYEWVNENDTLNAAADAAEKSWSSAAKAAGAAVTDISTAEER